MKKIARIAALVGVFALILVAIASSSLKTPDVSAEIWNTTMVIYLCMVCLSRPELGL